MLVAIMARRAKEGRRGRVGKMSQEERRGEERSAGRKRC